MSVYRSFCSLVKFMSNYFIVFDAIINEIILFISFVDNLLSMYKFTTDYCMLILYPESVLIHLLALRNIWRSLGFSMLGKLERYMQKKEKKRNKLDHQFKAYTRINSKWIKDLNVRLKPLKILQQNTGSKISDISHSSIFCWYVC